MGSRKASTKVWRRMVSPANPAMCASIARVLSGSRPTKAWFVGVRGRREVGARVSGITHDIRLPCGLGRRLAHHRAVTRLARSGRDSLRERVQCDGGDPHGAGGGADPWGGLPEQLLGRGRAEAGVVIPVRQVAEAEHSLKRSPQRSQDLQRARVS
jgi:hypothetical protein